MLTYEEITTPITRDEALQSLLDFLEAEEFPVTSWQSGDPVLTILMAIAERDSLTSLHRATMAINRHNATATGGWLKRIAVSDYDNTPGIAVPTRFPVRFSLVAEETAITPAIGDLVVATDDGERTYRSIESKTIPSGGYADIACEAEVAGAAGNVPLNTITTMVISYAGVTCTNPTAPTQYGADEEDPEALRSRNRLKWASLSFENTKDAVASAIRSAVPTIVSVAVDDLNPEGPGTVNIYCATALGIPGFDELVAAQNAARARYFNPSPRIQVTSLSQTWGPTGAILCNPTIGTAQTQINVEAALATLLGALPIGGRSYTGGPSHVLLLDEVVRAIRATIGAVAFTPGETTNYTIGSWAKLVKPATYAFTYANTTVS